MISRFMRYFSVGIVNTAIHWVAFYIVYSELYSSQALGNFVGFFFATVFSFFVNAKITFKESPTKLKFILFVFFMGGMSITFGFIADHIKLPVLITMVLFSSASLIIGFAYSNFVVFKESGCRND